MSNKNKMMLKTFFKVMKNDETNISLVKPNYYVKSIYDIDYKYLKQQKIKNLIFDIDNTLLPVNSIEVPSCLIELINKIKEDFNVCIVSNNSEERVLPVANAIKTLYLFRANKPNKEAYEKALAILDGSIKNTAMIGDQMLSDIKGANEFGLYTVLVEPLSNHYDIKTGTSRVLQNIMMNKLARINKFKRYHYYK